MVATPAPDHGGWVSCAHAARLAGLSPYHIRAFAHAGLVRVWRVPTSARVLYAVADVRSVVGSNVPLPVGALEAVKPTSRKKAIA